MSFRASAGECPQCPVTIVSVISDTRPLPNNAFEQIGRWALKQPRYPGFDLVRDAQGC